MSALDISKAFDSVNQYKLYESLLRYGVPLVVVDVLCDWCSKLSCCIRWNDKLSVSFNVGIGVRQGSCLSLSIVNVFMNMFITKLKLLDAGCRIGFTYTGCVLYADDIILLSPSVSGLQKTISMFYDVA